MASVERRSPPTTLSCWFKIPERRPIHDTTAWGKEAATAPVTTERAVLSALLGLLPEQVGNVPAPGGKSLLSSSHYPYAGLFLFIPRVSFPQSGISRTYTRIWYVTKTNDKGGKCLSYTGRPVV